MKKLIRFGMLLLAIALLCAGCQKQYDNPIVTIEFEDGRTATIELYPDKAPNTVANFVSLIQSGYYDGLTFHRASPDFVVQGGDPNGNGSGGPGYSIRGEFYANDTKTTNDLTHERGVISMARAMDYNSAGSQFFIVITDKYSSSSLDGKYAAFGAVTDGMDIFDEINQMPATKEILDTPVVMKKVTVDTFGREFKVNKITK